MTPFGWIGVWLLVASSVAIVLEGAVVGLWTLRLARRGRVLAAWLAQEQGLIQADVERLEVALAEMQRLWRPYARVLRWLRHPLVVALIGSYRRRWAAP